jgi:hypothetical protein
MPSGPEALSAAAHVMQGSAQEELQQKPSTQKPETHSPLPVQPIPLPTSGLQTPPGSSHQASSRQSVSAAHEGAQALPEHLYSPQSWGAVEHVPKPLQELPVTVLCRPLGSSLHVLAPQKSPAL